MIALKFQSFDSLLCLFEIVERVALRKDGAANDEIDGVRSADSAGLLDEIASLRGSLARCAARIAELESLANIDPLLNISNRRNFLAELGYAVARVGEHGVPAAILFLDVDGLKTINDTLGHRAGDKALVKVAQLLVGSVRQTDLVARFAGDEFAILLDQADELSAWRMALRIVETVNQCEFRVGGVCVALSVAVGVGVILRGDTPEAVIERADKEMYRIKAIGPPSLSLVGGPLKE